MAETEHNSSRPGPKGGPLAVPIDGPHPEMARIAREASVDAVTGQPISSSRAMARRTGGRIAHSTVVSIWRGQGVDAHSLLAFASAAGIDPAVLLTAGGHDPAQYGREIEAARSGSRPRLPAFVREGAGGEDGLRVPSAFAYLSAEEREKVQFCLDVAVMVAIRQRNNAEAAPSPNS